MVNKKAKLTTFGKIWRIALCILVPLGGGFLQRKVNAARLRKYDGNDYPLFELIHLTDQTVTADGKIFKAVTKEDAVVLKRFEELSIAVTERPE